MAKLAKAYVLGEPFQSKRAATRMTQAINIYTARLREIADAANELANTHFGVIDVRLDQEPVRERFFAALEAVFGGSVIAPGEPDD